jgi:glutamate-5-semialdehyde dehydrogenase
MDPVLKLVTDLAELARAASFKLMNLPTEQKNLALKAMAAGLDKNRSQIKSANAMDVKNATADALPKALIDRLILNDQRIDEMIKGVLEIALQSDPVGKLITSRVAQNGLELRKIRVPIGVVGIIFESRPNIISDVVALCLKSGNAVILRGGKEAAETNAAVMQAINDALTQINFVPHAAQMIPILDKAAVPALCRQTGLVDVVIPRGGERLMAAVVECATVPVIKHYKGVCHIYVDKNADIEMAVNICHNAKCQRPGVCNAVEKILIHEDIAAIALPAIAKKLLDSGVEIRACEPSRAIMPALKAATDEDWWEEYLDLIVAIKIVPNAGAAIDHINHFGSHHSDAIITNDPSTGLLFTTAVDSAAVYINASTRFTDGSVFGLGGELGISTDKLHARGPMGIMELTSYKWVGIGNGQVRG